MPTWRLRHDGVIHQPDNLETTARTLLIQEDPGSHNQYPAATGYPAFRCDERPGSGVTTSRPATWSRSSKSTSGSGDPRYDVGTAVAGAGGWESSGIIDASSIWGPGWFLIDVQAGTLILESEAGFLGPNAVTFEREGGQLLRVRIPGA